MVVIFKSKIAGDITMFEEDAKRILDLFGKKTKEGIITPAETGKLIEVLEEEIILHNKFEEDLKERSEEPVIEATEVTGIDSDTGSSEDEEITFDPVRFGARAYPLLELLKRANREKCDIIWCEEAANYL